MLQNTRITFLSLDPKKHVDELEMLKEKGCQVRTSTTLHLEETADVILIETNYTYFSVLKFMKSLQRQQSTATVILMGQSLNAGKLGALLRAGAFDYLELPFPPKRLEKTIRKGLKNRENLFKVLELSNQLEKSNKALSKERDQLKKWNDDLSQLYQLNQKLSESLNLDEVIDSLMKNIKKIVPYDIACLYLKGWKESRVEADRGKWSRFIAEIAEETRQDGIRFTKSKRNIADSMARYGQSEVLIPLEVGKNKIGILRLIRIPKGPSGKKSGFALKSLESQPSTLFYDYQSRVLSMISAPLAIAVRNAEMYRQVEELAVKDPLTNVLNRRAFTGILEREFRRASRYNTPITLMVLDLDYFKKVNDTYGHLVGDNVLREVAKICQGSLRDIDVLVRYGGEEFVILLPGTNLQEGMVVANRVKGRMEQHRFDAGVHDISVTVSIGIAHYPALPIIRTPETLFLQADQALYAAKRAGRNCIMATEPLESKTIENEKWEVLSYQR